MPTKQITTRATSATRATLKEHAEISLHCEPNDYAVEDDFSDENARKWIATELAAGNQWAWCCARVTATYAGKTGLAVLGGCSYESRDSFECGELATLTEEALDDLWTQLTRDTPEGRAKAMALARRQAIITRFRGPTDRHGSRIIARCEAKQITVECRDDLRPDENHAMAALQLQEQLGWSERNDLVMGGTRDGYVFVQVDKGRR